MTNAVLTTRPDRVDGIGLSTYAAIVAWFGAIFAVSLAGGFESPVGSPPWALIGALALPLALFGLLYRALPRFRAFVLALDPRPLILLHTFRTLGLAFLLLAAFGNLPLVFGIPAGVGDLMAAVGALIVGIALYSRRGADRRVVAAWNAFGIADLVVAVALGVLSRTGGLLHFGGAVPSDAMGSFPLALIPGFLVPLYLITHLVILIQLRARWSAASRVLLER